MKATCVPTRGVYCVCCHSFAALLYLWVKRNKRWIIEKKNGVSTYLCLLWHWSCMLQFSSSILLRALAAVVENLYLMSHFVTGRGLFYVWHYDIVYISAIPGRGATIKCWQGHWAAVSAYMRIPLELLCVDQHPPGYNHRNYATLNTTNYPHHACNSLLAVLRQTPSHLCVQHISHSTAFTDANQMCA